MEIQIALPSGSNVLQDVKESFEANPDYATSDVQLELRAVKVKYRGIDPTILVRLLGRQVLVSEP